MKSLVSGVMNAVTASFYIFRIYLNLRKKLALVAHSKDV